MVAIGELAYKCRFDARELTRGLMSTRAQMNAAKKIAEETRTPLDRYRQGLDNLAQMSQKYSQIAMKQVEFSKQLEKQYLQEESAVRRLTKAEKSRLELLQLPDQIKARAAATSPAAMRAAQNEANKKAGLARQSFFVGIDQQQTAGRSALADRLAVFKKEKAAASKAEEVAQAKAAKEAQAQAKSKPTAGGSGLFSMAMLPKYLGAAAAYSYAKSSVLKFAEVEKSSAAFEVLSGSMQKSKQLMTELRDLAKTGLSFSALSSSAQTMMSFGVATEKITPTLKALGDISRGDGERLKSLALAFGQTTAAGRLMGQEVLQMINAGFNPLQEISRKTGRSMVQLKKDMEEGSISASMVADSLISATTAGGRFQGMLAKISQTGAGSLTAIQNRLEAISLSIGESLMPLVKQLAGAMEDLGKASSKGRADSTADVLGNGFAGSIALIRSFLRNDWKPMSEVLDSMDAKDRDAQAAAAATKSSFGSDRLGRLQQQREDEGKKLLRIYEGKKSGFYKSPEDFNLNLSKQQNLIRWLDTQITKEKAVNKEKERRAEFAKKEKERAGQAASLLKPLEDNLKLEQFNAKSKLKASSLEEMAVIQKMNAAERERLGIIQSQLAAKEKDKQQTPAEKAAQTTRDQQKQAGEAMKERNQTAAERFKSQLADVGKLRSVGAIDPVTALRERMAIQSQIQNQLQSMQGQVPDSIRATGGSTVTSIRARSAEALGYIDDLRSFLKNGSKTKDDPQVKALEDLKKQNETVILELRRHTRLQQEIADTSPKRVR